MESRLREDRINLAPALDDDSKVYYKYHGRTTRISKKELIRKVRAMRYADYFKWFVQNVEMS